MQATHKAELSLNPLLPKRARIAHILPHLQSEALISIGKLCDDGCTDTLTSTTMTVHEQGGKVLEGKCNGETGMWQVKITPQQGPTPTHQPGNNLMKDKTKSELEQWYHNKLLSPLQVEPHPSNQEKLLSSMDLLNNRPD